MRDSRNASIFGARAALKRQQLWSASSLLAWYAAQERPLP